MKECNVKRCIQYGEDFNAFEVGQEINLTNFQKLLIEQFLTEEIIIEAKSFDRFIYQHTLFHSISYRRLVRRKNCVVRTSEEIFLSITNLLCVQTSRNTHVNIVIGKELEQQNETLCKNKNFSSSYFSFIVQQTENIIVIFPSMIETKCVCIPYDVDKFCVMPLVNSLETD